MTDDKVKPFESHGSSKNDQNHIAMMKDAVNDIELLSKIKSINLISRLKLVHEISEQALTRNCGFSIQLSISPPFPPRNSNPNPNKIQEII